MAIRIVLVDDHQIFREALRGLIAREHDLEVVGEAADGQEGLQVVQRLSPDVVVMDVGMRRMGGVEAARRMLAEAGSEPPRILGLSAVTDRRLIMQMLDAGATGYVVKSAGRDELLRAIRAVAAGRNYLCPEASLALVDSVRHAMKGALRPVEPLGPREREVLMLLADGFRSPDIAQRLNIATSTVEVHRRNIMRKLELHSIAELTKYAVRNGLSEA